MSIFHFSRIIKACASLIVRLNTVFVQLLKMQSPACIPSSHAMLLAQMAVHTIQCAICLSNKNILGVFPFSEPLSVGSTESKVPKCAMKNAQINEDNREIDSIN